MWGLSRGGPADAHDAGGGCGVWLREGQLVLMMLAVVVGFGWGRPAGADDAGRGCGVCFGEGQLMLMMLVVIVWFVS